ncbi:hypothetical protein DFH28DRAFT_1083885 [Melampsora americana]|nr:hypothetical protein DFH28DRAFT_1083885 [Melampsora americana]
MPPASSTSQARKTGSTPYPKSNPGRNEQESYTGGKYFVSTFVLYLIHFSGSFDNEGNGDDQNDHGSNSNELDPAAGLFKDPADSNQGSPSHDDMTAFESIMATLPVDLSEMVNDIISSTAPPDYFSVSFAMMARLEDLICKQTETHVENVNASWVPADCFKVYCHNLCAQLFIDPSIDSLACLLTDGPKGQNNCLERQVLSDLLSKNANGIRDVLPQEYAGEDGSKGGAGVSAALKEIERNGQSTFRKQVCLTCFILIKLLHNVLPNKSVLASAPPLNLIDFCGYRLASVAIYAHPPQDHKVCQWQIIDQKLIAMKEEHSVEFAEAFGQLVLIKDHKIFDGVRLYTQMEHSHIDDLVLPTDGEVLVEFAAPSVVPQFHKSLA